jgi:hypothetical protein
MFIIYSDDEGHEVLVTTPEKEPEMLKLYFTEGGRDVENYDREVSDDVAVQHLAKLRAGDHQRV